MKLVFVTNNPNKVKEVEQKLAGSLELLSLKEIGFDKDIEERGETLEENAFIKANTIYQEYNLPCFADDTGLEVAALNGAPGVFSARYAGTPVDSERNTRKLLHELADVEDRSAKFRTVICYIDDLGIPRYFEGVVKGRISTEPSGEKGFGYDPVFIPQGLQRNFAEMSSSEKNAISHRGRAIQKFVDHLLFQKS